MITFLNGNVVETRENALWLDVNGVGYLISVPTSVTASVAPGDENVTIHTRLISTGESLDLYGFMTPDERDLFNLAITVSGIGPKAGIKLLSLPKQKLLEAIINEDVAILTTIPGVGAKTAKRVILELKDKISKIYDNISAGFSRVPIEEGSEAATATMGLQSLGYSNSEIRSMLKNISEEDLKTLQAQEIIQLCLKRRD
ncbi:MAG TPA: Holliday junction branch migration protein RuvA [bacterium]|nr:Holliday junction branch migration protein RuvA [bacterium]